MGFQQVGGSVEGGKSGRWRTDIYTLTGGGAQTPDSHRSWQRATLHTPTEGASTDCPETAKKLPWRLLFCGPFFINDSAFSTTRAGRRSTLLHRSLLLADLLVTTVLHEIKTRFGHFLDLLLTWTAAASVINYLWVNLLWQTNCKFKSAFMLFGRNWTRAWFNHYFV